MSQEPKLAQPKVAESMFGDDTGFLSGLGIDFAQPEKVVASIKEENENEEVVQESVEESKQKPEKWSKDDAEPTIKEARVISK